MTIILDTWYLMCYAMHICTVKGLCHIILESHLLCDVLLEHGLIVLLTPLAKIQGMKLHPLVLIVGMT